MVPAVGRAGRIVRSGAEPVLGAPGAERRVVRTRRRRRCGTASGPRAIGSRRASTHPRSSARWSTGEPPPLRQRAEPDPRRRATRRRAPRMGCGRGSCDLRRRRCASHVGPNRCHRSAPRSTVAHSTCATSRCAPWWRATALTSTMQRCSTRTPRPRLPPDRIAAMVDELLDAHQAAGTLPETLHR